MKLTILSSKHKKFNFQFSFERNNNYYFNFKLCELKKQFLKNSPDYLFCNKNADFSL